MNHDLLRTMRGLRFIALPCLVTLFTGSASAQSQKYVTDLSGLPPNGVLSGNFNNFAIAVDLSNPVRRLSAQQGLAPGVLVATFDYADCTKGQEAALERPLAALKAGESAWIDYVDIELLPPTQRNLHWTGGVCYGTRGPSGKWRWNLIPTPLAYDAATDRVRARVAVQDGPVTGIKLVFSYGVPNLYAQKVTLLARPYNEHN